MSNTITAFFKGRTGVCESVYQYDYGMVIVLDGIEDLTGSFDCYFSTSGEEEAIPAIGTDNRVAIPNNALTRSGKVELHIPIHTGANDSEVEYVVAFKVIGRARPVDDGTPEQQTAIQQALALLRSPIDNIEQIVNEALSFTGDTFDEMQEQLDADQSAFETEMGTRADTFESGITSRQTTVESQFTNLTTNLRPNSVKTLWTGSIGSIGNTATLSESAANFDFLDIYTSLGTYTRVASSAGTVKIHETNLADNATSSVYQETGETTINFSGTTASIASAITWEWNSDAATKPSHSAKCISYITRIDGVKVGANEPAELTDIRVGADGKNYSSAGEAVRKQFTDLKSELTYKNCTDVLQDFASPVNRTVSGVTFAWDNLTCRVTGTATDRDWSNIYVGVNSLPARLIPGKKYYLKYSNTNEHLAFMVLWYKDGVLLTQQNYYTDANITVPEDANGVSMRLGTFTGFSYDDTVTINIDQSYTNEELTKQINDVDKIVVENVSNISKLQYSVENLISKNSHDILFDISSPVNRTVSGVTFAWDNLTCRVTGTATDRDWSNIVVSTTVLPSIIIPGKKYYLKYENSNANLRISILWYKNGAILTQWYYTGSAEFIAPDADGVAIRLEVSSGYTYNDTIVVNINQSLTNAELTNKVSDFQTETGKNFAELYPEMFGLVKKTYVKGSYKTTSGTVVNINAVTTDSRYAYCLDECNPGDVYAVRGYGVTNATALWAFLKSDGTIIQKSTSPNDTNGTFIKLTAPSDSAYFLSNAYIENGYALYKGSYVNQNLFDLSVLPLDENDFVYELIDENTYARYESRRNLASKDFLPDYILSVVNQSTNVRIAVFRYDLLGNPVGFDQWVTEAKPYYFNHSQYKYIINISYYGGSLPIPSKNDVLQHLRWMAKTNAIINENSKKENEILKSVITCMQDNMSIIMKENYSIKFANAANPIALKSYFGSPQVMHPKVLYFENGFGGHTFWMAYTPYPFSIDRYENPCIAWSDDGYSWVNIDGNPLDDPENIGYNSDTHLVYNPITHNLECWYRYVSNGSPAQEIIKRKLSSNGTDWGNAETLMTDSTGTYNKILSPSVITDGTTYHMWVVDSPNNAIKYFTANASDLTNWTFVRNIVLSYSDGSLSNYKPWHIDVIQNSEGRYVLCVMCRSSSGPWSLFIATSNDNETYETPYPVIVGSGRWDKKLYRSSIVQVRNKYIIYYSACGDTVEGGGNYWGIGITESDSLEMFIGALA